MEVTVDLLDTPGVLWPKLEDQRSAKRLAATGAISDAVFSQFASLASGVGDTIRPEACKVLTR